MTPATDPHPVPHTPVSPEIDLRDQAALALLGHDLRAALSDVLGGLRLISPHEVPAPIRLQFERVRASGELLARLLEQGLTVMLGEADHAPPEDINLRRFLQDVDLRWSGRASEKGLAFALLAGADLPCRIRVDRVGLERILSNIIGNAITYCDAGEVSCHVSPLPGGSLGFTIRDDGPGFPPEALHGALPLRHRPPGMTKPGSGMGLHIAVALTARLGGQLTLQNPAEGGAEVRLILPLADIGADGHDGHDPQDAPPEQVLRGKRVLIADDNATSQAILARFAASLGAEVAVVADGVAAVGRLERDSFDLMVVDIEMPGLSGLDVIRTLRAMPGPLSRLPVIAVTAYVLRSNRAAITAAGADAMLSKPLLCAHVFAAAVRSVLALDAPGAAQPQPPADSRLTHLLDMAGPEVAGDLLNRLVDDLHGVERGLVQGGSVQPGSGPDWPLIRDKSHVLISLAGAVGAEALQHRAEALNQLAQRQDQPQLAGTLFDVLSLLDPLIQHVAQVRDGRGTAA